jgi:hypothetical protein
MLGSWAVIAFPYMHVRACDLAGHHYPLASVKSPRPADCDVVGIDIVDSAALCQKRERMLIERTGHNGGAVIKARKPCPVADVVTRLRDFP